MTIVDFVELCADGAIVGFIFLLGRAFQRAADAPAEAPKPASETPRDPYRTPDGVNVPKPPIYSWHILGRTKTGRLSYECPKCSMQWFEHSLGEGGYCRCDACPEGHFHMSCTNTKHEGCGFVWIMRERSEGSQAAKVEELPRDD